VQKLLKGRVTLEGQKKLYFPEEVVVSRNLSRPIRVENFMRGCLQRTRKPYLKDGTYPGLERKKSELKKGGGKTQGKFKTLQFQRKGGRWETTLESWWENQRDEECVGWGKKRHEQIRREGADKDWHFQTDNG